MRIRLEIKKTVVNKYINRWGERDMGEKKPQHIPSRSKFFYTFVILLWIVSTIFACSAFRQPLQLEHKIIENKIIQKTAMDYSVEVIPCLLYPEGGIIKTDSPILTNITDSINICLTSTISAERPVVVQGTYQIIARLVSEGVWEKEFVFKEETPIRVEEDAPFINLEHKIVPSYYQGFIEAVEEDTRTRSSKYLLTIKPLVEWDIIFNDNRIPLDSTPEFTFELTNGLMKLVNEAPDDLMDPHSPLNSKTEFVKEDVIERTEISAQKYNLFGWDFSIIASRYVFAIISLLLLVYLLSLLVREKRLIKQALTEAERIDKKYRSKIIPVKRLLDTQLLNLESFKALLKIADEKEQPIFRYRESDDTVIYYVVDGDHVFSYSAYNQSMCQIEPKISSFESGVLDVE
jgi:hypothetical protein